MQDDAASQPVLTGTMYLYKQPEFLDRQRHGALGWRAPQRPFGFAADATALPLVGVEMASAQKFFPLVFSSRETPVPLAVLGSGDSGNLFIDAAGQWETGTYVPSYLRRYPFAVAVAGDEQFAVVIDRAADAVSEEPETPFFSGETLTAQTQAMVDFCSSYVAEQRRTEEFSRRLAELDLLSEQELRSPDDRQRVITRFFGVDVEKLNGLSQSNLESLFQEGFLAHIYAHLFSLENWNRLLGRMATRGAGSA